MAKGETPEGVNALPWPPIGWNMRPDGITYDDPIFTTFVGDTRTDMTEPVKDLLAERATTHGHIEDNAFYTEELLLVAQRQPIKNIASAWFDMGQTPRLCLGMVLHKIGRILSGNWREPDHWRDIAGYATLVADRLERKEL